MRLIHLLYKCFRLPLTLCIQAVLVSFAGSSTSSFSCEQLQQLVSTLRYDQEKAAAAKLLYPRIRDSSNADLFIELLAEAEKADIRKRMGLG
jgi:hypothetical protein